jgi:Tfp pilus assembly protein FimT
MLVVIVMVVILSIAIPEMLNVRENYRLNAVARDVSGILNYARIMTVTENEEHRVLVVDAGTYAIQEDVSGTWTTETTYAIPDGFSIGAVGAVAQFHTRGNATPVATFTVTNPNSITRDVVVETSGRSHVQ